jgi:hypothetical protein
MDVVSVCPLQVGSLRWMPRAGSYTLTVVAKATFRLVPGVAPLADVQDYPNEEDNHWNDDPACSVYSPSDLAPFKPRADVTLVGDVYAPGGEPVRALVTRLMVGPIEKAIEVVADRFFDNKNDIIEGDRFKRMALRYERASGGPHTNNPVGIDKEGERDRFGRLPVPNLVKPGTLITDRSTVIDPVGYGPIAARWTSRRALLGRHQNTWNDGGWFNAPIPGDIDAAFFNVAPLDQRLDELRDNERITLEHMHPKEQRLVCHLPGLHPVAFVQAGGGVRDLALRADSLWIDTTRSIFTVTWRARLDLARADEPGRVYVGMEKPGEKLGWTEVQQLYRASVHDEQTSDDDLAAPPGTRAPGDMPFIVGGEMPFGALATANVEEHTAVGIQVPRNVPDWMNERVGSPRTQPRARASTGMIHSLHRDDQSPAWMRGGGSRDSNAFLPPQQETTNVGPIAGLPAPVGPPPTPAGTLPVQPPVPPPPPAPPVPMPVVPIAAAPPPAAEQQLGTTLGYGGVVSPWAGAGRDGAAARQPGAPVAGPMPGPMPAPMPGPMAAPMPLPMPAPVPLPRPSSPPPAPPRAVAPPMVSDAGGIPGGGPIGMVRPPNPAEQMREQRPESDHDDSGASPPVHDRMQRPAAQEIVEVLWYDDQKVDKVRERNEWREHIDDSDRAKSDAEDDDDMVDFDETPKAPEPPEVRDRRHIVAVMTQAHLSTAASLPQTMREAVDSSGNFEPPLIVMSGILHLPFDELRTLKATLAAVTPMTAGNKELQDTVNQVKELLGTSWLEEGSGSGEIARGLTDRVRAAWQRADRLLDASYLDDHTERILLEQRCFQTRTLLGDDFIRGLLAPSSAKTRIPVYIPIKLKKELPMFKQFAARLIAEAHVQQDQYESYDISLKVFVLGRVVTFGRGSAAN